MKWHRKDQKKQCKRQGSIFRRMLAYLVFACLLTAFLSVTIYFFTGGRWYAKRIADELTPRAYAISRLASRLQTGQLSLDSFVDFSLREQDGCQVFIFDNNGDLLARTFRLDRYDSAEEVAEFMKKVFETNDSVSSVKWTSKLGIAVGVPISDNLGRTIGAVILTKPSDEVYMAMRSFVFALLMGSISVAILMVFPAYLFSRRMSDPIRRMKDVSEAMASGDFSVRADETENGEIGRLGASLNSLSAELAVKITDLTLAQTRLTAILDSMEEGVLAVDFSGEPVFWNNASLGLFHAKDVDTLRSALVFGCKDDIEAVMKDQKRRSRVMDLGERKLRLTISFSQESSGSLPGAVIVVSDITASERLEQTRRDYVANVSHELRTPVASIRSLAETLNDGLIKSEEDRSRYYSYILSESMRLTRLINDLLELSRLQSGNVALEKKEFDLAKLVTQVTDQMDITASYSGIRVVSDLHGSETIPVLSNRDRIEQVLVALVDNGIKYASGDGRVKIDASVFEDRAVIAVRSSGRIAEKDLPHLFERFYKADSSHSSGGTGLGLAITREVLQLLGESIVALNDGDDAVFRFTLHKKPSNTEASSSAAK